MMPRSCAPGALVRGQLSAVGPSCRSYGRRAGLPERGSTWEHPLCNTVCFKGADDLVKPYAPSMDGKTEADDWYVGVFGQPPE